MLCLRVFLSSEEQVGKEGCPFIRVRKQKARKCHSAEILLCCAEIKVGLEPCGDSVGGNARQK